MFKIIKYTLAAIVLAVPAIAGEYGSPGNFNAFRSNIPVQGGVSIYAVRFNKNGMNYLVNTENMGDNVYTGSANVYVVDRGIVDTSDPAAVTAYIEQEFTGYAVTAVFHSAQEADLVDVTTDVRRGPWHFTCGYLCHKFKGRHYRHTHRFIEVTTVTPQRGGSYW